MNNKTVVAFIDSGIGGIPYLVHALEHIPNIRGIYIADTEFFPYGNKMPEDLQKRLQNIVRRVELVYNPDLYVLACNTASVVGLESLRQQFSKQFVGTVPAIKPAAKGTRNNRIGVMATEQTLKDPYLSGLIETYAAKKEMTLIPASDLISGIETDFFTEMGEHELKQIAAEFLNSGCDTVVLGCTHFIHLESRLSSLWEGKIALVDSREGISRQILRIIESLPPGSYPELTRTELSAVELMADFSVTSGDRIEYYKQISDFFRFHFRGVLHV